MKPTITVVIPNWNGAEMLQECLESLQRQTVKADIIVVDNGSSDSSVELVSEKYPEITLIQNKKNLGFAGGVNAGIRHAISEGKEFVVLLNNDVVVKENWLEMLAKEASKNSKCGIVASEVIKKSSEIIDNTGECFSIWGLPFPRSRDKNINEQEPASEIFGASGGSTLYRVKMLEEIGLFDEDFFAYYEDADINFRAQLAGWKAHYAAQAIAYHEIGGTSGKISGFTTYHTFKNLPWLFIKNVPLALMPKMLPRFALIYSLMFLKALLSKNFFKVLKAVCVSAILMPKKLYQRYKIQRSTKVPAGYISSILYLGLPPNSALRKVRLLFNR